MEKQIEQGRVNEQPPKSQGLVWRWSKALVKAVAYAVFLVITVGLLLYGVERLARYAMSRSYIGLVYPTNPQMALRDYTKPVTHYDYDFVPGVCVEYNTNKGKSVRIR